MQALLGRTSEARWLRQARAQPRHLFPCLPQQPGCNKRLRAPADTLRRLIGMLARDAVHRSAPAGWVSPGSHGEGEHGRVMDAAACHGGTGRGAEHDHDILPVVGSATPGVARGSR